MEQQTKRYGISLAVTVLCHVGAALWLGMAGFLFLKPPVSQEPIEIVLNTGGGQAGGGQKALPSPVEETAEMDHPSLSTQEEEPTAENVTEDFPIMEKQEDPVVEEVFHRTTLPDTNASSLPSGTEMPASLSGAGSGSGSGEGDATGQGASEGEGSGQGRGDGEGSGSQGGVPVTPPSVVSYVEPDYPGRAMLDGTSGVRAGADHRQCFRRSRCGLCIWQFQQCGFGPGGGRGGLSLDFFACFGYAWPAYGLHDLSAGEF